MDIVERLRGPDGYALAIKEMREDAAAEIERLRAALRRATEVLESIASVDDLGPFVNARAIDGHAKKARAALGEEGEDERH